MKQEQQYDPSYTINLSAIKYKSGTVLGGLKTTKDIIHDHLHSIRDNTKLSGKVKVDAFYYDYHLCITRSKQKPKNGDRFIAHRSDLKLEANKKHKRERKELYTHYAQIRRANLTQEDLTDYEKEVHIKLILWRNKLSNQTGEKYHIDHRKSLAVGGSAKYTNLQVVLAKDNLSKGTSDAYIPGWIWNDVIQDVEQSTPAFTGSMQPKNEESIFESLFK